MGILDRYSDWKEIDKGKNKNIKFKPEQPNKTGYILPSLKKLRCVEDLKPKVKKSWWKFW